MIFVDTGAWFAFFVREDPDHTAVAAVMSLPAARLLTTDYVVDELLTLLKTRGQTATALRVGQKLLEGRICRLDFVSPADIYQAWVEFQSHRDWSFTDCVSLVVMRRLRIETAVATDNHFRQFGDVQILP